MAKINYQERSTPTKCFGFGQILQYNILYLSSEQVDENKSNTIEFDEFLALMASDTWADIEKNEIVKVRN